MTENVEKIIMDEMVKVVSVDSDWSFMLAQVEAERDALAAELEMHIWEENLPHKFSVDFVPGEFGIEWDDIEDMFCGIDIENDL